MSRVIDRAALTAELHEAGFDVAGIARADALKDEVRERLQSFLTRTYHGDMDWMERRADERGDPRMLWHDVISIVMVGLNYGPDRDPMAALEDRKAGTISVYAERRDYHDVLKTKLKQVARRLAGETQSEVKVFVDTAPVMEKPLAEAAGLGWQGKHTNLVSTEYGSWLFLGALFTTLEVAEDPPHTDHCGSCSACLDICPTKAFPAPYVLDARRCISYLTIEHKGHIAAEFRKAMGNRIYGCDDCLAVCPWNKFARASRETALEPRAALQGPRLADLAMLDDSEFRALFAGTPIKRTGRDRFVRNVMIAIGNSGERALLPVVETRLGDASPLVRAMAVWALSQIAPHHEVARLSRIHAAVEKDPHVLAEWAAYRRSHSADA